MVMKNQYFLASKKFAVKVARGSFRSLRMTEDMAEYVLPEHAFADLEWHQPYMGQTYAALSSLEMQQEQGFSDGIKSTYSTVGKNGKIQIAVNILLHDGVITQRFSLKNISSERTEIDGLRFKLPCNTTFKWGDQAGEKVLPHAYISDHGSHIVFNRCDGQMPALICFPGSGDSFEYYDLGQQSEEAYDNLHQSSLYVYYHSAERLAHQPVRQSNLICSGSKCIIDPGQSVSYELVYAAAASLSDIKEKIVTYGLAHVDVVPGLTVPTETSVKLAVHTLYGCPSLSLKQTDSQPANLTWKQHDERTWLFEFSLNQPGENEIILTFDGQRRMTVTFFVTEPLRTLIEKRAAFIAEHQEKSESRWYRGLLCEWNNKTGVQLNPDKYDEIKGWRIYEVSCDDPGLSKPAYLASKQVVYPVQKEIEALDDYIEYFVWGGLQRTTDEMYPYGIYGIPDWKQNRDAEERGIKGQTHIWRIYDYPHLYLTYFHMYQVARDYPEIKMRHSRAVYLERAYQTCLALYTIPAEVIGWSAFDTGLYNELVIEDLIEALKTEARVYEADRLQRLWDRKALAFIADGKDIFGSEYPFDTTGFESTQALARRAISLTKAMQPMENKPGENHGNPINAISFLHKQAYANLACRGLFEPAYYWYGSDYRGNNYKYTLSYMSQMGGQALLDYAIHDARDHQEATELLRYAYGSLLSSWALMNTGKPENNYGYWFPGAEHDGTASGGFEPLPSGTTWLGQKHQFGPWIYSCEIDLGFCGALRGAATVVVSDPLFGMISYGGTLTETAETWEIIAQDGVNQRFCLVLPEQRVLITLRKFHMSETKPVIISRDGDDLMMPLQENIDLTTENLRQYVKIDACSGEFVIDYSQKDDTWIHISRRKQVQEK